MGGLALAGKRPLPFQNHGFDFPDLFGRNQNRAGLPENVVRDFAEMQNLRRHFRLEFRVAGKRDDGLEAFDRDAKAFGECGQVFVVLAERILEAVLPLEMGDGPLGSFCIAENPPGIGLGFNDEHAPLRNDNVVDLGCRPIIGRQVNVVENAIPGRIQFVSEQPVEEKFSTPPFDDGLESADQSQQYDRRNTNQKGNQ